MTVKPPPKKWEAWAAGFLLLIYFSNASASGADAPPINDLFLFAGIAWLIAIWVRFRNYKKQFVAQPGEPLPPPQFPPPGRYVNYETSQEPAPAAEEKQLPKPPEKPTGSADEKSLGHVKAFSETAAERSWENRNGTLWIYEERMVFQPSPVGSNQLHYQLRNVTEFSRSLGSGGLQVWLNFSISGAGPVRFRISRKHADRFEQLVNAALTAVRTKESD